MSVEAMKQAVKALEYAAGLISPITKGCQCQICLAHTALRQAIEQAEKQEPVAWIKKSEIAGMSASAGLGVFEWKTNLGLKPEPGDVPLYTALVHAIDETPPCKTDPRAPHGFDRNASHSADRYVCECEGWEPSPEPPPECQTDAEKTAYAFGYFKALEMVRTHTPEDIKKIESKWVSLTDEEIKEIVGPWGPNPIKGYTRKLFDQIEAKLKEKNT